MVRISIETFLDALKGNIPGYIQNNKVVINNCEIICKGTPNEMLVSEVKFEKDIEIYDLYFFNREHLIFNYSSFKVIEIGTIHTCQGIKFHNNVKIKKIIVKGEIEDIEIRGGQIGEIAIGVVTIKKLVISGDQPYKDLSINKIDIDLRHIRSFYLLSSTIQVLDFSRIAEFTKYDDTYHLFSDLEVKALSMTKVEDGNNLYLEKLSPLTIKDSTITVSHSRFDNVIIRDCNFRDFKNLKTLKRHYDKVKSEYTIWFKEIVNWEDKEDIVSYRQFKTAMRDQNDKVSEIYFRSKELDAYLKWLKFRDNKSEWILLWANRLSNNHGTSWSRGLLFTSIISMSFFILYLASLQSYKYSFGWHDWKTMGMCISDFIGYFSKFFIPTHDFNFMVEYKPKGISFMIDTLSRIFIGYGIYQTIQAFRKHGK